MYGIGKTTSMKTKIKKRKEARAKEGTVDDKKWDWGSDFLEASGSCNATARGNPSLLEAIDDYVDPLFLYSARQRLTQHVQVPKTCDYTPATANISSLVCCPCSPAQPLDSQIAKRVEASHRTIQSQSPDHGGHA